MATNTLRVQLPAEAPSLTPAAAKVLLQILLAVHNDSAEPTQGELPWDRTA